LLLPFLFILITRWHYVLISAVLVRSAATLYLLQYFVKYKLAPVSPPGDYNATNSSSPSVYQDYFLNVLSFVAQIPNILLSGANVFCQRKGYVHAVAYLRARVSELEPSNYRAKISEMVSFVRYEFSKLRQLRKELNYRVGNAESAHIDS